MCSSWMRIQGGSFNHFLSSFKFIFNFQGAEECHDETKTIVGEKPEEECIIEPQRQCRHVTKLVPQLQEVEECVDVPKEICTRSRTNPKKVKKPVIKKWCYIPSEESGLARK